MSIAVRAVLVPVAFEPDAPAAFNVDRSIEVRKGCWVSIAEATVSALRIANNFAGETGGVHLVHATRDLTASLAMLGPGEFLLPATVSELHEADWERAHAALDQVAQRFCRGHKPSIHVERGRAADIIGDRIEAVDADFVVMAASGRTRAERIVVGSTVEKIIRRTTCPVLVVPR